MNYFPLIERELRLALRRRSAGYGIRLVCGVAATVAAFGMIFVWSAWNPTAGFGRPYLQLLSRAGFLLALLLGIAASADALSREKREGTLDLLLLTDLRIHDIVLGKLLASMVQPFYGFLAIVPILEISVLLGGATPGECFRLYIVWLNTLFFALALGLLASAAVSEQRNAQAGTILLVLFWTAGIPMAGAALSRLSGNQLWWKWSALISPTGLCLLANAPAFAAAFLLNQVTAWGVLALARRILLRCHHQQMLGPTPRDSEPLPSQQSAVTLAASPLGESAPMLWLMARRASAPWPLWISTLAACAVAWWNGLAWNGTRPASFGLIFLALGHLILKLAAATDAVHGLIADRRSGTLESLLGTPVTFEEITGAMRRWFLRRVAGPVCLMGAVTLLAGASNLAGGSWPEGFFLVVAALLLPLDILALFWNGLFQGLAAPKSAIGLVTVIFETVLLPWAWFFLARAVFWRSSLGELLVLWIALAVLNQGWFLSQARNRLKEHFRTLALKPYGGKNPRMESEWSAINWDEEADLAESAVEGNKL